MSRKMPDMGLAYLKLAQLDSYARNSSSFLGLNVWSHSVYFPMCALAKDRGSPIRSVARRIFTAYSPSPPEPLLWATLDDLSIDDNLSQLDRLVQYSTSNIALQRLVHTRMIGVTAQLVGYDTTVKSIVPILHTLCSDSEYVIRQHLAWQIRELAEVFTYASIDKSDNNEPLHNFIINMMLPLLATLLADRKIEVCSAAAEALVGISCLMDPADVGKHVLTIVVKLAHDFDEAELRSTAAGLLNDLAESLGKDLCHQFVIADIVSLGEDTSHLVRKAVASSLNKIAHIVGPALSEGSESMRRDLKHVADACRAAIYALQSVVNFSKALGPEVSSIHLTEVTLRLATDGNKLVRSSALQHLGPFISTLKGDNVGIDEKLIALFIAAAGDDDPDLRQSSAFSFPAVLLTLGPSQWNVLRGVYNKLMCDEEFNIRRTLACSLHEVAQVLTKDQVEQDLVEHMENLLLDVDKVRIGMIQHLHVVFSIMNAERRAEMLPLLLMVLESSNNFKNWRLRDAFASLLPRLVPLFPASTIFDMVVPPTFLLLDDPIFCVRSTACNAISPLHASLSDEQRDSLVEWVCGLSTHQRSSSRLMYIYIVQKLPDTMSKEDFSGTFSQPLVFLANDKVVDVRVALARGLRYRTYPQWFAELPDIQSVITILRVDENVHVRDAMSQVPNIFNLKDT